MGHIEDGVPLLCFFSQSGWPRGPACVWEWEAVVLAIS